MEYLFIYLSIYLFIAIKGSREDTRIECGVEGRLLLFDISF